MIKRIACGKSNCYIVGEYGNAVLVDTAAPRYLCKLYNAALNAGVKFIFLTHAHYEHAGCAAALAEKLGISVGLSEADLGIMDGSAPQVMKAHKFYGKIALKLCGGSMRKKSDVPAHIVRLSDGMELSPFGAAGEVMELCGHTFGSLGLVYENALFAGDAMSNVLKPSCTCIYADAAAAEETFARILGDSRIARVYVSHGSVIELDKLRTVMTPAPVADF